MAGTDLLLGRFESVERVAELRCGELVRATGPRVPTEVLLIAATAEEAERQREVSAVAGGGGVPEVRDDVAITTAIIAMAHGLGLEVVAEGIETEEQLAFLRTRQCDAWQGFLFSRPLPNGQFLELTMRYRKSA